MTVFKLPLAIEIEINSDCNLSCAYCPNDKSERIEKGHMQPAVFETLMQQLAELDYAGRISYHFYNEPTLSPNLNMFVQMTKQYLPKCRIVLYTNGTNLNKNKIQELESLGVQKFMITQHIKTELTELHSENYHLKNQNETTVKLSTYKEIPFTNRGGLVSVGKKINVPLKTPCFIPYSVLVVSVLGNVISCYEDFNQKHVMGNINQTHLRDIWNSEKYLNFRNEIKRGHREKFEVCKTCNNQSLIV